MSFRIHRTDHVAEPPLEPPDDEDPEDAEDDEDLRDAWADAKLHARMNGD